MCCSIKTAFKMAALGSEVALLRSLLVQTLPYLKEIGDNRPYGWETDIAILEGEIRRRLQQDN